VEVLGETGPLGLLRLEDLHAERLSRPPAGSDPPCAGELRARAGVVVRWDALKEQPGPLDVLRREVEPREARRRERHLRGQCLDTGGGGRPLVLIRHGELVASALEGVLPGGVRLAKAARRIVQLLRTRAEGLRRIGVHPSSAMRRWSPIVPLSISGRV
jgi:hypothetical protein